MFNDIEQLIIKSFEDYKDGIDDEMCNSYKCEHECQKVTSKDEDFTSVDFEAILLDGHSQVANQDHFLIKQSHHSSNADTTQRLKKESNATSYKNASQAAQRNSDHQCNIISKVISLG